MKSFTKFGLIANAGAIILGIAVSIGLGIIVGIFGGVALFDNAVFSGIFGIVVSFTVFYFVLWSMLKDKKMKKSEREDSLKATFIIYLILTLILSVLFYQQISIFGLVGWIATLLEIASVWGAIKIVDQNL